MAPLAAPLAGAALHGRDGSALGLTGTVFLVVALLAVIGALVAAWRSRR